MFDGERRAKGTSRGSIRGDGQTFCPLALLPHAHSFQRFTVRILCIYRLVTTGDCGFLSSLCIYLLTSHCIYCFMWNMTLLTEGGTEMDLTTVDLRTTLGNGEWCANRGIGGSRTRGRLLNFEASRDSVLAFLTCPLTCEGCESGEPVVGVYDVVDADGACYLRTRYCRTCLGIVLAGEADCRILTEAA